MRSNNCDKWKISLLVLSTVLVSGVACCLLQPGRTISQNDSDLRFHIDLPRRVFRLNEPIYLSMTLTNESDAKMVIKRRLIPTNDFYGDNFMNDVTIEIVGPNGRNDKARINPIFMQINALSEDDFLDLYPGQSFSSQLRNVETLYLIDRIGFYRVSGRYENDEGFSDITWEGVIDSNQEWFIVIP